MKAWVTCALAFAALAVVPRVEGTEVVMLTRGGSMYPAMPKGEEWVRVETSPRAYDLVKVGDVVIWYTSKGRKICHRVIKVSKGRLWTAGDANWEADHEWVTRERWVGVVVGPAKAP